MVTARQILAGVPDPEIPALSIVDLGIVRRVEVSDDGRRVAVTLTPTYSACPAFDTIVDDARAALETEYDTVDVRVQLSPAWTTDWITPTGRERLRAFGIAPPVDAAPAGCPRCGAPTLEELAPFGSTPCKALWRCSSCREPFDYFKRH